MSRKRCRIQDFLPPPSPFAKKKRMRNKPPPTDAMPIDVVLFHATNPSSRNASPHIPFSYAFQNYRRRKQPPIFVTIFYLLIGLQILSVTTIIARTTTANAIITATTLPGRINGMITVTKMSKNNISMMTTTTRTTTTINNIFTKSPSQSPSIPSTITKTTTSLLAGFIDDDDYMEFERELEEEEEEETERETFERKRGYYGWNDKPWWEKLRFDETLTEADMMLDGSEVGGPKIVGTLFFSIVNEDWRIFY